jgi:hypothetical protein
MEIGIKLAELKNYIVVGRLKLDVYDCKSIAGYSYLVDAEINGEDFDIIVTENKVTSFMVENYEMVDRVIDGEQTMCVPEYDDQGDVLFCTPYYEYFENFRLEIMQDLIAQTILKKDETIKF